MTKEYNQHLDKVLKSHRYTQDGVYDQLKVKRNTVVELIQKEYGSKIYSPFDSGSILKKTAIRSHFDYDIIVPFKHGTFEHPKEMLELFYKSLQRKNLKIRKQNVSVGLDMDITPGKYDFDIVPGLEKSKGDFERSKGDLYLYPHLNANPKKIITNIKEQLKYFKRQPAQIMNIVKLVKIWKYGNDVRIKSYLLELLTIESYDKKSEKELWLQLRNALQYIGENIENAKATDPGNDRNNVGDSVEKKDKKVVASRAMKLVRKLTSEAENGRMDIIKESFPLKPIR